MKKIFIFFLAPLLLISCVSTENLGNYVGETESLSVSATTMDSDWILIQFDNKKYEPLKINTDLLTFYSDSTENAYRLIPENTKNQHSDSSSANFIVPPNKTVTKFFTASERIKSFDFKEPGHFVENPYDWIKNDKNNSVTVVYTDISDDKSNYILATAEKEKNYKKVGTLKIKKYFPHFFYHYSTVADRRKLFDAAMEKAKEKYGTDVSLKNINMNGSPSFYTVFMYCGLFGWIEKAELTADIVKK